MYYLCYIRKRDYRPIKLNNMKVREYYQIQVECDSLEEYLESVKKVESFLGEDDSRLCKEEKGLFFWVEYLDEEDFDYIICEILNF